VSQALVHEIIDVNKFISHTVMTEIKKGMLKTDQAKAYDDIKPWQNHNKPLHRSAGCLCCTRQSMLVQLLIQV
jgi:hypothetical protein